MTMEIMNPECEPFWPIFAVFAILGQVRNTISPWGKGPSQEERTILVAYEQGLFALGFRICPFRLAGAMQLMMPATLPNFAFTSVFGPVA